LDQQTPERNPGSYRESYQRFQRLFGDTAIIIDGIAPYRWLANWFADVEKWRENLGVSYEHLSYEMGFWERGGFLYAYAVIAGTLTVTIKGQTVVRTGTLAYTFSKMAKSGGSTHRRGDARRKARQAYYRLPLAHLNVIRRKDIEAII
jgi:hypothetical protein